MENKYNRAFPNLMKGKKVMYVHGFASSAKSGTVALLRALMPNAKVVARDVPVDPRQGMSMLRDMCSQERPDLIIGTSAGGMMSEMLYGFDRILINPAFQMGETMLKHDMLGRMQFQNPREDGQTEFIVTKALVKLYGETTSECFGNADSEGEQERVWGMFGDEDPIVDTFGLFSLHYKNAVRFHGGHRLTDHIAIHYLIPLIRRIDDRQEGREKPILYICIDSMRDSRGKPVSGMHKGFESLLENYDIHFVCPAPTNCHSAIPDAQLWIEDVISSPAHDRILFANDTSLLYGDFIISSESQPGFMGTSLRLGSDEFKTWDDLVTFFGRLGGG